MKPRRQQPERALQMAVADLLRLARIPFTHCANERKDAIETKRLKREGVMPGVFDVLIFLPGGQVAWCELKAPGGSLTRNQRAFGAMLDSLGHRWAVVRSLGGMVEQLKAWGVPGSERIK